MTTEPAPLLAAPTAATSPTAGRWKDGLRRALHSPTSVIGAVIVVGWVLLALLAPLIAPYSPEELAGPALDAPSGAYLLGTDDLGRDVLSRLLWGARTVLVLAPLAVIIAEALGAFIGLAAGYLGGRTDEIVMRFNDALISFPAILLYLLIIAALGASKTNVVIAIVAGSVPGIARIVRGVVVDLRLRSYVAAARLRGERAWYVMFVELLPNARGPLIVDATLRVGYAAFAIGTLGFLGLGPPPPTPDWGGMVNSGVRLLAPAPWIAIAPGLALMSLVVGLNLFVDGLESRRGRR